MSSGASTPANSYGIAVDSNFYQYESTIMPPTKRVDSAAAAGSRQQRKADGRQSAGSPAKARNPSEGGSGSIMKAHSMMPAQPPDSLEYFIKFPTPRYPNEMDAPESDYVFVYKEANVPIVLLLGWAGCQDRYLMKYSKIYEDRGLITVRYTAPVDTLFWKRSAMKPIGEKILKLIYDMNFDTHPLIFHVFSNGGAYLYQHILLAIKKHKTPIQVRGMIFDSAPGDRRILGLYRAVTAIYGKDRKKCYCLTAIFITLTLSIMWFVEEAFSAFKSLFVKTEPVQTSPFNDLKNEASQFPQMFLYSKADVVIPYQDVEKFIKYRQQHGIDVTSVCFDDAEHVKIYTKYPTQYIHYVCTFINNCLSIPYKGPYLSTSTSANSSSCKYD